MSEIKRAIQSLANAGRMIVCVNGETFGIWDVEKNTFVD